MKDVVAVLNVVVGHAIVVDEQSDGPLEVADEYPVVVVPSLP